MKVVITKSVDIENGATLLTIDVNDTNFITSHDADPEDANFDRNFNGFLFIGDLIREAYNAGKNGEPLLMDEIEEDW
jgi:hypothetical protein